MKDFRAPDQRETDDFIIETVLEVYPVRITPKRARKWWLTQPGKIRKAYRDAFKLGVLKEELKKRLGVL